MAVFKRIPIIGRIGLKPHVPSRWLESDASSRSVCTSVRDDLQSSSGRGRRQKSIVEIPTVAWRDPTQTRPSAPTTHSSPVADVEEALRPQSG